MKIFGKITPVFSHNRYFQADCEEKMNESQTAENYLIFKDSSQFITKLSASLRRMRCIFKQLKRNRNSVTRDFLARAEGGGTPTAR